MWKKQKTSVDKQGIVLLAVVAIVKKYNHERFRPKPLLSDLWKTLRGEGLL